MEHNSIRINPPSFFNHKSVEVIVLPLSEQLPFQRSKEERLNALLSIGTWTAEDIQPILNTQQMMNQWKMESF